jgi:hypothetical protein
MKVNEYLLVGLAEVRLVFLLIEIIASEIKQISFIFVFISSLNLI